MEVVKHKTVNRTAPVPTAAAHPVTDRRQPGTGTAMQLPSPSTRRFADSGILGKSKVADYLATKGEPVRIRGANKLKKLRENEQKHDNATEKLSQVEQAVVIPAVEGQSAGNAMQIVQVDGRKVPAPAENMIKQQLQASIAENIPQTIEEVDNFKNDNKASQMGEAVMTSVRADKNSVVSTFSDLENMPEPVSSKLSVVPLPAEERELATPVINLGEGAIAPLQAEHTDVNSYTKEADAKLKEEGITQDQLDLVDSGDLAVAGKEKKSMEKMAKSEPQAIRNFARQEGEKVESDLKIEEKRERDGLKFRRKADLGATKTKQKNTKSALEKKREEVALQINTIYQTAQKIVGRKLAGLEIKSMKNFDAGNSLATSLFEDNVKREMDAFKAERYKGLRGKLRKAKDWLLGMKDLPQVKAIFDRNRSRFVSSINQLIEVITAANKSVISECKTVLATARKEITVYVSKLGPGLRETGAKAAEEMNGKLAALDGFIEHKEQELQRKLSEKQVAAIKAIDDRIEKMKEAMSGALSKIGNLLLQAAKKFFTWALKQAGYSLSVIEGVISKGASVLKSIFTQPVQFAKNLINAAITGFKNFGKNFLIHLKNSLFEWLTGSLEGLVLPQVWDVKGIVGVALQMIGITYQNIRQHLVAVMGETVVGSLEKTFTLVKTLVTQGPMAAWEQLKEMAGEMQLAFIEAVRDFLKMKVIEQAIQWLVGIFVPGAGIVKAVIAIYDTVVFFIQKAKQIIQMIGSFLSSVGEIASGNIGAAASALESGLSRGLTVVISFLAQLLHLNAITDKIKAVIQKIRGKVDAALAKVARWIADKAKSLFGKVKSAAGKVIEWWGKSVPFKTTVGEDHHISLEGKPPGVQVIVKSDPTELGKLVGKIDKNSPYKAKAEKERDQIKNILAALEQLNINRDAHVTEISEKRDELYKALEAITSTLRQAGVLDGLATDDVDLVAPEFGAIKMSSAGEEIGGKSMKISQLTYKNAPGTQQTTPPQVWDKINAAYPRRYIRGHLLNANVGGRGDMIRNLTPLTSSANGLHKNRAEYDVKKLVLDDKKIVRYFVSVNYKKNPLSPAEKLKLGNKADPVLEELAASLSVEWQQVRIKKKGATPVGYGPTIKETIPNPRPEI
ncbi:MAG: DNA/RNA non-specific endonuclease [Prolixibacteraceae bacterium]